MKNISMIGVDLAKNVFQVHGVDAAGKVLVQRQLRRRQMEKFLAALPVGVVVGMEACGGAHHWGRLVQKLGHQARLMPAGYVKPYVKRNKNDGRDAEGVCEAMGRPTMRFVPVKSVRARRCRYCIARAGCWFVSAPWRRTRCIRRFRNSASLRLRA